MGIVSQSNGAIRPSVRNREIGLIRLYLCVVVQRFGRSKGDLHQTLFKDLKAVNEGIAVCHVVIVARRILTRIIFQTISDDIL